MPIYEFYCESCNTIFNFFSKTVKTQATPPCPRCKGEMQRQVSMFACLDKSKNEKSIEDLPLDESKLEKAMQRLTTEAERMNEEDPKQAAEMMRKFSEMTGVRFGDGMQEAIRRMESGEDPEQIEAEMGDVLENEDPFMTSDTGGKSRKKAPARDETLYEF